MGYGGLNHGYGLGMKKRDDYDGKGFGGARWLFEIGLGLSFGEKDEDGCGLRER